MRGQPSGRAGRPGAGGRRPHVGRAGGRARSALIGLVVPAVAVGVVLLVVLLLSPPNQVPAPQ